MWEVRGGGGDEGNLAQPRKVENVSACTDMASVAKYNTELYAVR